jgi:hypothetical protein
MIREIIEKNINELKIFILVLLYKVVIIGYSLPKGFEYIKNFVISDIVLLILIIACIMFKNIITRNKLKNLFLVIYWILLALFFYI